MATINVYLVTYRIILEVRRQGNFGGSWWTQQYKVQVASSSRERMDALLAAREMCRQEGLSSRFVSVCEFVLE